MATTAEQFFGNAEVANDPMFKAVQQFAERERAEATDASGKAQVVGNKESVAAELTEGQVRKALERKNLELRAREMQHKEEKLEKAKRDEQMKAFARASQEAEKLRAAQEAREKREEDTPEAREEALREIGQLREVLGVTGSYGKRAPTAETPLVKLRAEIGIMHAQVDLERAAEMPRDAVLWGLKLAEVAATAAGVGDYRGTAADVEQALKRSEESSDPMERHLHRAMLQASIKYSSWFRMGPEMYLALQFAQIARARKEENERGRAVAQESAVDEATEAEFDKYDV